MSIMAKPFTINLEQAKKFFFDSKLVESLTDKATRRALSRVGAYIRTTARRSLRRRKKSSRPGEPPSTHTAGKRNLKFILFAYERSTESVIVGPVRFGTKVNVANLQEFGGTRRITRSRRGKRQARYKPRPFMQPALEAEAPKLPNMMKEALEKQARGRRR